MQDQLLKFGKLLCSLRLLTFQSPTRNYISGLPCLELKIVLPSNMKIDYQKFIKCLTVITKKNYSTSNALLPISKVTASKCKNCYTWIIIDHAPVSHSCGLL